MYQPGGGSVWFRALVDGTVAEPSDVQFKQGNVKFDGVRTFTFVKTNMSQGQHLVEIQMLTGSDASIRDRVLTVRSANFFQASSTLAVASGTSGAPIKATSGYKQIPGLTAIITSGLASTIAITFSAEAWADSGKMMVRAVVNGTPTGEVIFAEAGDPQRGGTRSFTFVGPELEGGFDNVVSLEWKSSGGVSRIGDRTMSATAAPVSGGQQRMIAVNPSNPQNVTQTDWIAFADEIIIETTDSLSNVAITMSTEVLSNKGRVFLRATFDGEPASPADVTLIEGGPKWRATAHTFIVKNAGRGRHSVRAEIKVDPQTTAKIRRRSVRVIWARRQGPDFVQPYLGMSPLIRNFRLLVIGFDPVRPAHARPSFEQIRNIFEGSPQPVIGRFMAFHPGLPERDPGPNLRDWLMENSGGVARLGQVRYVGCRDGNWFVAPPQHQGDWYWNNQAWDQMWKDALAAADPEVDFHSYDTDQNNRISSDELVVAIVRPQNEPYGTLRGTNALLDSSPTPLNVPILDLYLSSDPTLQLSGLGMTAHELSHHLFGAPDLYNGCPAISPGLYSIMDNAWYATHLDPFVKMKNGMVLPWAIDLDTVPPGFATALGAVERHYEVLILYSATRAAREYFMIENRYPGDPLRPNYDGPIGTGAIVIWQIFEDRQLVQTSAICPGDPRYIRKRAVLASPASSTELTWSDGSSAGHRVVATIPNAEFARLRLEKI
jgi:M6 family metalloprotease-like protein